MTTTAAHDIAATQSERAILRADIISARADLANATTDAARMAAAYRVEEIRLALESLANDADIEAVA